MDNIWKKKTKGTAKIYTREGIKRSIVVNYLGIKYAGRTFTTLENAKKYAINHPEA